MSFIDRNHPAPFGTETNDRMIQPFGPFSDRVRKTSNGQRDAVAPLGSAELDSIDLTVASFAPMRRPGLLARAAAAYRNWDARRRTVAELERLTDSQLADIGLMRAHVEDLRHGRAVL